MVKRATLMGIGLAFGLAFGIGMSGVAEAADNIKQVIVLDECDPATFNGAFGPDTCWNVVSGGGVTLTAFLAALPAGHPAWLFYSTSTVPISSTSTVIIEKGDTIRAINQGGEIHTFTKVVEFGGGFIPDLNNPPTAQIIPECAGGYAANPALAATRLIQGSSLDVTDLTKGLHHFECCVHPWMRIDIDVK
jgi:hypothetical protein